MPYAICHMPYYGVIYDTGGTDTRRGQQQVTFSISINNFPGTFSNNIFVVKFWILPLNLEFGN